ncbi:MAG: undecaprenyldiphospho-muramoylpentapeptide beta-N-acetylglucosaminyltransferase [Proteobacteria bacterium]|nr:undecaprenyldiphospho-muramoylpentapeptide beta-N-acetylglucosaminyltransferase [Pseudomonadota bacterium]
MMKVLIAGGGTGGHFFSGVAVGEAFLSRGGGNEIVYVGTRNGIEARVGPQQGLDVRFIDVAGIRGKGLMSKLKTVARLPLSLVQSMRLIMKVKPKMVIGVGGYASGPVVVAARLMGKKTGIVEQNSVAGTTNRILGKIVHRVFIAFEDARDEFPASKVHFTGNPIREGVVQLLTLESTGTVGIGDRLKVLVLGGSQGARALNEAFMEVAPFLSDKLKSKLHIVHQTGTADEDRVRAAYAESGLDAKVEPFIHEMAEAYRSADLVICRAGALTISELTISRRGSVLVPYPHAIDNHQQVNAQALVDGGAAEMILQKDLTPQSLGDCIERLSKNRRELQMMAWKAGEFAKPQAATEVVDEMYRAAGVP